MGAEKKRQFSGYAYFVARGFGTWGGICKTKYSALLWLKGVNTKMSILITIFLHGTSYMTTIHTLFGVWPGYKRGSAGPWLQLGGWV